MSYGPGMDDMGAERRREEEEMVERTVQHNREIDELEEDEARDAKEAGVAPPKRPWWKFWS